MNTNEAYMDKMHDLFSELEKASQIFIMGREGSDIDMFTGETPLVIISVNKCKTPKAYGNYISRVCQRLVDRAMEAQAVLRPGTRAEFLKEVNHNFGRLVKVTLCEPAIRTGGKNEQKAEPREYLFRSVLVNLEAGMEVTVVQVEHFRKLAFRYSREWRRTVKKTRAMIDRLAEIADYLPDNVERKGPAENKIIVRSTESRLALLARVFFDIVVFATGNKSELCRCFIKNFGTVSQFEMSAKQFKKRFDKPDDDAIEYLRLELKGMLVVLDNLEKRYN